MNLVLNREAARLEALHQYQILDTLPEEAFDDLAILAAQICNTPIALINLIDANRQWFKAKVGTNVAQMPREVGFCGACVDKGDIFVVNDALLDERFATSPVVIGEPYVRFYAGVPLKTSQGHIIGTVCVIDSVPKEITQQQIDSLRSLARLVIRQLDIRQSLGQLAAIQNDYRCAKDALHESEHILSSFFNSSAIMMGIVELCDDDILHISDNTAAAKFFGLSPQTMHNRFASDLGISKEHIHEWMSYYQEAARTLSPVTFEYPFNHVTGQKWLRGTVSSIVCCKKHKNQQKFAYIIEDITESKRAESERLQFLENEQAAHSKIANIFESITDGFFALENNWCFSYLNKQAETLLQVKSEAILGKNIWEVFPEAVDSKFYQLYHRAVTERVSIEFEEFDPQLNSWFAVHAYPSQNGLSVYFQDITKRKEAEENLNCQQAILHSMNSVSPLGFYVVEKCSGQIYYLNNRFCEIWGIEHLQAQIERGELKNRDVIAECQKIVADIPAFVDGDKSIHNQKNLGISEDEILLGDGRIIRRVSTKFRQEGQCCFGRLYIFEDITARKRAEQQIRERSTLLDATTDAIILRDLSNNILLWNKSAEKLYGWQSEEAIGKNAESLLSASAAQQYKEIYNIVLEKGSWQGELLKQNKAGLELIVESRWTLVLDEWLQPKSILSVDTDITQKKQLETQFLRTQRMESIGTLASGIAHDLNNVLSPILMSAHLLKSKCEDERNLQMLKIIENNAKRGADLVKQVLSFARGMEGNRTTIQLRVLIAEIQQIIEQTFSKLITLDTQIQPNLFPVSGDNTQLHQVLINLCLNARDAMPDGGRLRISADNVLIDEHYASMNLDARVGAYVLLKITDTGVGIDNELLDRIFEPFFTTKDFGKGTGLGLSTVIGIIKGHGGFIRVSSCVGNTEFKVYLPAVVGEVPLQIEELQTPPGNGELILVVDDEPAIREITQTTLENHNYQVITANDGIEAIALYAQYKNKIKAAIIDMMMPNMDGSTTINTLQRMNPSLPIIAVSGLANSEQIPLHKDSKLSAFLPKPYTAHELFKTLHTLTSS
jgi:PAS domain S-box-containing protein